MPAATTSINTPPLPPATTAITKSTLPTVPALSTLSILTALCLPCLPYPPYVPVLDRNCIQQNVHLRNEAHPHMLPHFMYDARNILRQYEGGCREEPS
eukprot:gene3160-5903_t